MHIRYDGENYKVDELSSKLDEIFNKYILEVKLAYCAGFGDWEEDLLDYGDKFGRIDQALNIIIGKDMDFGDLLEMYSEQLREYYE
jgi:hypothetical protein